MDYDDITADQLALIPYKLLASELAKRNAARRRVNPGRAENLQPCPKCGRVLGTRQRRKACPNH